MNRKYSTSNFSLRSQANKLALKRENFVLDLPKKIIGCRRKIKVVNALDRLEKTASLKMREKSLQFLQRN